MRVLVATDLGAASDEAVRQGIALTSGGSGTLALCHVLHQASVHALFPQAYQHDLEQELERTPRVAEFLREQVERIEPGHADPFDIFVEQGSDYVEIARRAERWRADWLIVGTHGRTGVARLLLGSVAEHMVRHAPCTVLVARDAHAGAVLVASDLSDPSLHALEVGAREAARRGSKLVVMHVLEPATLEADAAIAMLGAIPVAPPVELDEARRSLSRQLIRGALERCRAAQGQIEVVDGNPLAEILRVAEALPAELVVIGAQGQSGLSRLLGNTAAEVVRGASCSVLAVRR